MHCFTPVYVIRHTTLGFELSNFSINGLATGNFESYCSKTMFQIDLKCLVNELVMRACSLKYHCDEKFVYQILFLVNYNYEMSNIF